MAKKQCGPAAGIATACVVCLAVTWGWAWVFHLLPTNFRDSWYGFPVLGTAATILGAIVGVWLPDWVLTWLDDRRERKEQQLENARRELGR